MSFILNPYRYASGYGGTLLTSLTSWWKLDETSGVRYDAHGSNDLTEINTVGYESAIISNGAALVSANSEYLKSTSTDLFGGTTSFSVACWAKHETGLSTSDSLSPRLMQCRGTGSVGTTPGYCFKINATAGGNYSLAKGNFFLEISSGTYVVWDNTANTDSGIAVGNWFHFATTIDRDTDEWQVYINGSAIDTAHDISALSTGSMDPAASRYFTIGASDVSATQFWNGAIDEAAFWRKVLSTSEVEELYNSGSGMTYPG